MVTETTNESLTVTHYTYTVDAKPMQFYFSHDTEELDPANLIESVTRYEVYSDGTVSEKGEVLKNPDIVDFDGQTPESVYTEGKFAYNVTASIADEFSTQPVEVMVYIGAKGDTNMDGTPDAKDAATILLYAADVGAGIERPLYSEEDETLERLVCFLADVNGTGEEDSPIDAKDAAAILIYAAAYGSGEPISWEEVLGSS